MTQPSGWYDDPHDPTYLRYFDGVIWTENRAPKASPTAAQSTIGLAQAPTQARFDGGPPVDQAYGQRPPYGRQPGQQQGQQQPGHPYAPMPPQGGYGVTLGGMTTPDGVPLASWGQRAGAYVLDYLILGVVTAVLGGYFLYRLFQWYLAVLNDIVQQSANGASPVIDQAALTSQLLGYLWPYVVIAGVTQIAYNTFFLTRKGATPGKMALGLAVRRRDRPGHLSVVDALKRQALPVGSSLLGIIPLLGTVISLLPILDLLWPLWDGKRQALHDKIADTNVVLTRPR